MYICTFFVFVKFRVDICRCFSHVTKILGRPQRGRVYAVTHIFVLRRDDTTADI